MANGKIPLSKSEQDKIIRGIRSGQITLFDLPENLYEMYGEEMTEAVFKGLGTPPDVDLTLPDYKIERQLKENAYRFSSAKVFNYVNDTANALIDEKGMVRPFDDFKEIADGIGAQYNENWLKTEYETALNMADSAGKWRDIQQEKEIFPLLKYQTSEDAAVRKDHVKLNGIIKPVDDDFWKTYYPPNGWNCRCDAIQISEGKETDLRSNPPPKLDSKLFEGNAGKSGKIFTQKHPYFNVPKEFKEHKKNNFGLPLPQDITAPIKPTPSAFIPAKTIKEVENRIKKLGVEKVSVSGVDINEANNYLQGIEIELKNPKARIKVLQIFSNKKEVYNGNYSFTAKVMRFNAHYGRQLNKDPNTGFEFKLDKLKKGLKSREKSIELDKLRLGESKELDKRLNKEIKRNAAMLRQISTEIEYIEGKIKKGETQLPFSYGSTFETTKERMISTVHHEFGHHWDDVIKNDINFDKSKAISEYAQSDKFEYIAEMYSKYKITNSTKNYPKDLIEFFKEIEK